MNKSKESNTVSYEKGYSTKNNSTASNLKHSTNTSLKSTRRLTGVISKTNFSLKTKKNPSKKTYAQRFIKSITQFEKANIPKVRKKSK